MKSWALALAGLACVGCTAVSLNRHALAQTASAVDLRYREVLDNLAMVANDPDALPAYSSIFSGLSQVTDSGQVASTTVWQHATGAGSANGFASEAVNPQLSRQVLENWALDPIVVPEKLEAMRCACRWVLYGPERACDDCRGLLATPEEAPYPGRHFGVAGRLARLPAGWLHVGGHKDVPAGACYKAHCGHAWVWVERDGLQGLADFTLVLHDIATLNIDAGATSSPPVLVTLTTVRSSGLADPADPLNKNAPLVFRETRLIRPEYRGVVEAKMREAQEARRLLASPAVGLLGSPLGRVALQQVVVPITPEEWQQYTVPYPGNRTNVSPQGGAAVPVEVAPRLVTPERLLPVAPARWALEPLGVEYYERP